MCLLCCVSRCQWSLTVRFHGLSEPPGGGREQCSEARGSAEARGPKQHSELVRAQVEEGAQACLQQAVQGRQAHGPKAQEHGEDQGSFSTQKYDSE